MKKTNLVMETLLDSIKVEAIVTENNVKVKITEVFGRPVSIVLSNDDLNTKTSDVDKLARKLRRKFSMEIVEFDQYDNPVSVDIELLYGDIDTRVNIRDFSDDTYLATCPALGEHAYVVIRDENDEQLTLTFKTKSTKEEEGRVIGRRILTYNEDNELVAKFDEEF